MQFIPALSLFTYCFWFELQPGKQLFYIGVDSIILVFYATVLISLTLISREEAMKPRELFSWNELFKCNVDSDDEKMYRDEPEENKLPGSRHRPQASSIVDQLNTEC